MRTLKKTLCLVLAIVMILGLGAFSAVSAADETADYAEAKAVTTAVKIFQGDENGALNWTGKLTRAQAAVILTALKGANADSLPTGTRYTDAQGHWAEKYINYVDSQGLVVGWDGNFDPDAPLTGYAWALMLLRVLGYSDANEGIGGEGWEVRVAAVARNANLDDDMTLSSEQVTREEAAQYVLNALEADMVNYPNAATTVTTSDGTVVTTGGGKAQPRAFKTGVTYTVDPANAGSTAGGQYLQLIEDLYGNNLQKREATNDMGAPDVEWTYKQADVCTLAKAPTQTVVVSKAGKTFADIIDDISKSYDDTTADPYGDGAGKIVKINGRAAATTTAATAARIGDVMEVYMSSTVAKQVDYVIVTRYSAAKVTGAVATKGSGDSLQVRVPGVVNAWTAADEVNGYEGLAKDDIVYYYRDNAGAGDWYLYKADSFNGQVTRLTTGTPNKYTIDGTQYIINGNVDVNDTVAGLTPAVAGTPAPVYNTNYQFWTDGNGYIIYGSALEETNKDYVMIETLAYVAGDGSIGSSARVEARIVKMDGTTEVVKVKSIDDGTNVYVGTNTTAAAGDANADAAATLHGAGTGRYLIITGPAANTGLTGGGAYKTKLFTAKSTDDGYEFTTAAAINGVTTNSATTAGAATTYKPSTGLLNGLAVNDSTVFVVINNPAAATPKFTVYTGKSNVPELTDDGVTRVSYTYTTEKSVATNVVVWSYASKATTGDWIYLLGNSSKATTQVKKASGATTTYYVYDAYVNGEVAELNLTGTANTAALATGIGLYTPTYDSDGYVTGVAYGANQANAFGYNLSSGTLSTGKTYGANTYAASYNAPSNAPAIYKDADGNFTVTTVGELGSDANDKIYTTLTNANDNTIKVAYVMEKNSNETGLASVVYNATAMTTTTAHAAAGGVPAYTEYAKNAVAANNNLVITTNALCLIEYNTAASLTTNADWTTFGTAVLSGANIALAADTTLNIRITAEDSTVAYYQIHIDAA